MVQNHSPEVTSKSNPDNTREETSAAKRLLRKGIVGGVGLAVAAGALAGCSDGDVKAESPSPTTPVEVTVDDPSASPEVSESPSVEVKIYDQLIEDIDPQDYVIEARDDYTAEQLAQALTQRHLEIRTIFNNDTAVEAANTWNEDIWADQGHGGDMDQFRKDQMKRVVEKLKDVYYTDEVAATGIPDDDGLAWLEVEGWGRYSVYTKGSVEGVVYTDSATVESALMTDNDDGTYNLEAIVYTKDNSNEIDPEAGNVKTERYTYHLVNENGQVRVISVTRELL